jgi:hypothetical protein
VSDPRKSLIRPLAIEVARVKLSGALGFVVNNRNQSLTTSTASTDINRRLFVARIPLVIEVASLVAWMIFWLWPTVPKEVTPIALAGLGAILVVNSLVCLWVLIHWFVTGELPELSLSPLVPSREEYEFHRNLRERPNRNDEEFYATFYASTEIPKVLTSQ